MASLVLLRNPLAPHTREIYPLDTGTPVIDWLQEKHPDGFGMPIRFYVNGDEKPIDDLDYRVGEDDVAVIALMPALPATLTLLAIQLAVAVVLAGASIAINYFFAPKEKSGAKGQAVSVYDISSDQNAARIGEAIPVVYGSVQMSPDYVAQPWTYYDWDQSYSIVSQRYNGIQYLNLLLCVGQGNIDVSKVFLADTSSSTPGAGVIQWRVFKPADHRSTMGVISAAMGGGFHENVITSSEVSNQEFVKMSDVAGPFATCKPGTKGSKIQIDIVFPVGQTNPTDSGNLRGRTTLFEVQYYELDDNDNAISTTTTRAITTSTIPGQAIVGPNFETIIVSIESETNRTEITSPIRRSYLLTMPKSARWAVKIIRTSNAPNARNGADRFIWAGLKLFADYPATPVYGNVTLLAARIKASQGIGPDASVRLRVAATRRINRVGGGAEAQSTNPADAFADVLTNSVYGANRPAAELDVTTLMALRTKWASYQFNYVFTDRTTVWDALRTITTPFAAEPTPVGQVMSVAQDGVKAIRSALFTDANIVENTMNIIYSWDEDGAPDGIEIEYLDPKDYRQSYVRFPTTSLRPEQFALPGVTSATHASQYAQLAWQRRQGQRKRITFDTELEGLLLQMGDRIGVSHHVPKWGDSGLVIGYSGNTLTVDHDLNWSGDAKQILLRAPNGSVTGPISVIRGTADNKVVMQSPPAVSIQFDNNLEYTSFAFGTSTNLVRDFVVVSTIPSGEQTVTVEAVNYNPAIFTGTMSFTL